MREKIAVGSKATNLMFLYKQKCSISIELADEQFHSYSAPSPTWRLQICERAVTTTTSPPHTRSIHATSMYWQVCVGVCAFSVVCLCNVVFCRQSPHKYRFWMCLYVDWKCWQKHGRLFYINRFLPARSHAALLLSNMAAGLPAVDIYLLLMMLEHYGFAYARVTRMPTRTTFPECTVPFVFSFFDFSPWDLAFSRYYMFLYSRLAVFCVHFTFWQVRLPGNTENVPSPMFLQANFVWFPRLARLVNTLSIWVWRRVVC